MDKPIFELVLENEAEGLQAIAFVDDPAIGLTYQAFKNQLTKENPLKFQVVNEEKRLVVGPAMIPDLPIYRYSKEKGDYYVLFSKKTVSQLVEKWQKEKNTDKFNQMHDGNLIEGVFVRDSWITDSEIGIPAPKGFENVNDGTWFISAKIENDDLWREVKETGTLKGFSVEGIFSEKPFQFDNINTMNDKTLLQSIKDEFDKLKKSFGTKASELKVVAFDKQRFDEHDEVKMGETVLVDGTTIKWEGDLMEGTAIKIVTPEGEISAEDGEWELEDGRIIITKGGLIDQIMDAPTDDDFADLKEEAVKEMIAGILNGDFKTELSKQIAEQVKTELAKEQDEKIKEAFGKTQEVIEASVTKIADLLEEVEPATPKNDTFADNSWEGKIVKMRDQLDRFKQVKKA